MIDSSPPISDYYNACNSQNFEAQAALFSATAVVEDEGQTYRGATDIRLWAEKTQEEYGYTITPLESRQDGDTVTVATKVSGTLPDSPIDLNFAFRLDGDKISALTIAD